MHPKHRTPLIGIFHAVLISFMVLFSTPAEAADCSEKSGIDWVVCQTGNIWEKLKDTYSAVKGWTEAKANETWDQTKKTWTAVQTGTTQTIGFLAAETNKTVNTIDTTLNDMSATVESTTEEVLTRIQVAAKEVQFHVEFEAQEFMDFIGGDATGCSDECRTFREDLLVFIEQAQSLSNTLITFSGTGQEFAGSVDLSLVPPVDYAALNNLIANAPGSSLYPIYRTFKALDQAGGGGSSILVAVTDVLYLTDASIQQLQDVVRAPAVLNWSGTLSSPMSIQTLDVDSGKAKVAAAASEPPMTFCRWLQQDYEPVNGASIRQAFEAPMPWVQGSAMIVKTIGNMGDAISHAWEAHAAASAGWVAEAEIHIKGNRARTFFKFLSAVGDTTLDVSAVVSGNIQSCDTQVIQAKQDYIICILENTRGGARAVEDCKGMKQAWQ